MSNLVEVLVPDIGNFESVDVIEVLVKVGDVIAKEDSLITVESDKASMDIPSAQAGVVKEIKVKVGDKVAKGHLILLIDESATTAAPSVSFGVAAFDTLTRIWLERTSVFILSYDSFISRESIAVSIK